MRIIVTGGTGLIGHALVMELASDGHEVVVLSRNPRQAGPMPETVSFVKWDARTAEGWGHLADGADAIVNLAGASIAGDGFLPAKWTRERKKLILNSRLHAGKAVVEAVKQAQTPPKVVIQASGVGFYGTHDHSVTITEESPAGQDFLADVCKQWEASTAEVTDMGTRQVVIRTGVVLSTEGGALPRLALPFKLFAGGPLGSGKQPLPWIHIDDEVKAIRYLISQRDASGAYNLTAPNPVTNREFGNKLGRVLGRPSLIPAPGFAFNLAFGEVATVVLDGQKAVPQRLQESGYEFIYAEAEAALRQIYGKS